MKILMVSLFLILTNTALASIKILSVRGESQYIRENISNELNTKSLLQLGDIIKTMGKSFVKIQLHESVITIAPNSYYKVSGEVNSEEGSELGTLLYGHLHASFKKNKDNKRVIRTPTAAMGVRGTKILLHVARDQTEYSERYKGVVHPAPTLEELNSIVNGKNAFSQVCCITGKIAVKTNGGTQKDLDAGQVLNYTSTGKNTKFIKYNTKILEATAGKFGF